MKTRWGRLTFAVEDEEYTLVELRVLNDESSLKLVNSEEVQEMFFLLGEFKLSIT
jgi:hypothetical protein